MTPRLTASPSTYAGPNARRASLELILAGALWGFAFIAQRMALESWTPLAMMSLRFGLAFLVSLPFILLMPSIRSLSFMREARAAFAPGLLLGLVLTLQTYGLKSTSIANSGFITTLYVLFVPLFCSWGLKQAPPHGHSRVVMIALIGAALMCEVHRARLSMGDLWTFGCAVVGAVQIAWVGWAAPEVQSPFLFNTFQSFWVAIGTLAFTLPFETIHLSGVTQRAWFGLGYQIIGATLLAFFIQIRAQRVLSSSTASILFLLEAPFAAVFGYICFRETLSLWQLSGAVIILAACFRAARLKPGAHISEKRG